MSSNRQKEICYTVNENGCYICTSHARNKDGYPRTKRDGKYCIISRYLWEKKNGVISKGMCVLHHCDNPACINVEDTEHHCFLGTPSDNSKDMASKNRSTKGEKHPNHKITEKIVLLIREESDILEKIADKYNISIAQVSRIKNRKRWK